MIGRPLPSEAAPYFSSIDLVPGDDPVTVIANQLDEYAPLLEGISEEASLARYEPGKWSIRQVLSHITDTERAFTFRVLWFARGFTAPLPGFDQDIAVAGAESDRISWGDHVEEFRQVRQSTVPLLRHLPEASWARGGVANNNHVTVRALAFMIGGHAAHHVAILRERYLNSASAAAL